MLIAIEGLDGSGKTTLAKKLYNKLLVSNCYSYSNGNKCYSFDDVIKRRRTFCCPFKCVGYMRQSQFEKALWYVRKSVREIMKVSHPDPTHSFEYIVKAYISSLENEGQLITNIVKEPRINHVFRMGMAHVGSLDTQSRIIILDRYHLSALNYTYKLEVLQGWSEKWSLTKTMINHLSGFRLSQLSFDIRDYDNYMEHNTIKLNGKRKFNYVDPATTIFIDAEPIDCYKNCNKRRGKNQLINQYDTLDSLKVRYDGFKVLMGLAVKSGQDILVVKAKKNKLDWDTNDIVSYIKLHRRKYLSKCANKDTYDEW